jgi:hypothetical protein
MTIKIHPPVGPLLDSRGPRVCSNLDQSIFIF